MSTCIACLVYIDSNMGSSLILPAAFADINIAKGRSVYYQLSVKTVHRTLSTHCGRWRSLTRTATSCQELIL